MARLLLPALVGVTLLASVVLSANRAWHTPADGDLDAAAAAVRGDARPGDLIVVEPDYMVGPRERLGDLPLVQPRSLAPEDLQGVSRVHLLSLDVIGATGQLRRTLDALAHRERSERFGLVDYVTYSVPPPPPVLFDLREGIADVRVSARYPDGVEAACDRFDHDRWICPRHPQWSYVGRELLEIGGKLRACVWMHPVAAGGVLRIELPALETTVPARITGGFGFTDESGTRAAAPVEVQLRAGEERLLSVRRPTRRGWERFAAELPAGSAPLVIEVSTSNPGAAHFCAALRVTREAR